MTGVDQSSEPLAELAKEVARQLPVKEVYQDLAAPATQQTGQLFTDIVKTVQLALAPLQFLAAYQDRLRNFIDRSVRRVPSDKRISPAPQILGPIIEGIRYESEGTPLDEMFSQLLSSSMNSDKVNEAHPAFPILIKQLSSDEAKIIHALATGREYVVTVNWPSREVYSPPSKIDDHLTDGLTFPGNVVFYFQHLQHLGLIVVKEDPLPEELDESGPTSPTSFTIHVKSWLTDFGRRFARACIGDSLAS